MLTFRSIIIGIFLTFLLSILAPYSIHIIHGSPFAWEFAPVGAIFFLFLLILINFLLKKIRKSFVLSPAELLIVMVMLWIASSIVTMGFVSNFLPILSGLTYYGTPSNEWAELILPHVPSWLIPQDQSAIVYFYEGLPSGHPIPWKAWLIPLAIWTPFIITLYFVMVCMMAILHHRWSKQEKLRYPLVELPVAMVSQDKTNSASNSFFKNRVMWFGFAFSFLWGSYEALHHYFPLLPPLFHRTSIPLFRRTVSLIINFRLAIIGFAYLMSLDVSLSLWLFAILGTVQTGIQNITGFSIGRSAPFSPISASVSYQGMGAMITLVAASLYSAKRYLKDFIKSVFSKKKESQNYDQLLSPKISFWGIIIGFLFMAFWLSLVGLSFWLSLLFLLIAFIIFLALTRIVAQAGIPSCRSPLIPQDFLVCGIGSSAIGIRGLVALAYTFSWGADLRTFVMASVANSLKMTEDKVKKQHSLLLPIFLAIVTSLAASIWITMKLAYLHGGANLNRWFFVGMPRVPFRYITLLIKHPESISGLRYLFTGIGAAFMTFLIFMQYRFLWWPLSPLGFPIANTYPLRLMWFSIFISWLIKSLILKYGGPRLYNKSKPFFLGLILGQFVCMGTWVIIDFFTKMEGNAISFIH